MNTFKWSGSLLQEHAQWCETPTKYPLVPPVDSVLLIQLLDSVTRGTFAGIMIWNGLHTIFNRAISKVWGVADLGSV